MHPQPIRFRFNPCGVCAILWSTIVPSTALATWSIVAVDCRTGEVAVGSATCLTNFDLRAGVPVVMVGLGGGAAQSAVDNTGLNRSRIRVGFIIDRPPSVTLRQMAVMDAAHQSRQYGIVDVRGRRLTFTGNNAGDFADGLTGEFGDVAYAIQGNVITGWPVLEMAEEALVNTPGDLPIKLMAAMEAARSMGGDGRCSCAPGNADGCGSPPDEFDKSAHIAFMIVARAGDTDGTCNAEVGCASGDYFMNFNVAFQTVEDPDPVFQLQDLFDAWRDDLVHRTDGVRSVVTFDPPAVRSSEPQTVLMSIHTLDHNGAAVEAPLDITVEPAEDSPGRVEIGAVSLIWPSQYIVPITTTNAVGIESFKITVHDPERPVVLMPHPQLVLAAPSDLDLDGDTDLEDAAELNACLGGPDALPGLPCAQADGNADQAVDLVDFADLQSAFSGEPCKVLEIAQHPLLPSFLFCGQELTTSVDVQSTPAARLQWLLDGEPIPGATEPTYHVASVTEADEGMYSVRVVNTCGIVTSESDNLVIVPDPRKGCRD